jgi:hypothetical protein
MANKFLEQMKASDWVNLAGLGLMGVQGLTGGKAAERTAKQAEQQDAWNRQLQQYNAQMAARNQLAAYYDQLNATRAAGRQALLNASPLGEEQEFVGKQALRRGLMGVMGNFQPLAPASADIAGLIRPTTNVLSAFTTPDMQQAASVGTTARSLAERRKAKAGVDPTFQFGSMADYGVPNLEKEVATYAQGVAADRLSRENQLLNLLTTQMQAANALSQPQSMQGVPPTQSSAAAQPKKSSWWKKVLNVAATAAPIVAAPFTGGTSLALIGAGSGALKGALSGGAKGALTGAAMGAATSAIGGGAAGEAAKRGISEGVKESASAAIKRAILNPRALTQLGGAAVGGPTEQMAQMISPFLPGAKAYVPRQTGPKPMGPGATVSSPLYDRIGPAGQSLPPSGSVTPPDLSGRTPTPTGSGTLGGFRRAGNLFEGMGPAQAQQPFIPMQTPGIQPQLTSPRPTAAPVVPQAGIRVPLRGVNGSLPPVTTLTIPASEFFFGPRPSLAPSEGRLPNGQWNIFGQTVPLPQVSAGMPALTGDAGDDSAVVANRAAMYELMYANPAQPQIVAPPVAPSPVPASANTGTVPRFNFGSGISTQAPNVSGLRWFGNNIPTPAVGPATMPVSTRGAQRIGAPISNPAMDVNMITPDGTVVVVPFSQMSQALSLGLRFALGR